MSLRTTGAKAKEPNRGEGEKVKRSISHDNIYGWNFTISCANIVVEPNAITTTVYIS